MPKPLVIVGNGEIAALAYEYFTHDSERTVAGFTIGPEYISSDSFLGKPLAPLSALEDSFPATDFDAFVAVGDFQLNRVRRRLVNDMIGRGYSLCSYVSSRAFVWHNVTIGDNCFILENNVLQPFVSVGNNVTLWSGNHIGHRSVIEDDVFIASHAVISGFCRIGRRSFLGVNSTVAHQVDIAPDNYIAMGAVIGASTNRDTVYQGNPAEPRKVSAKRLCQVRD